MTELLPLVQWRNAKRPTRIIAEKDSGQRPIFTCKSATEELGEKAMLLRDALGMARAELVALIGAGSTASTRLRATKELRDQASKVQVTTTTQIVKPTGCARTANPCIRVGVIAGDATDQPVLQGMVH